MPDRSPWTQKQPDPPRGPRRWATLAMVVGGALLAILLWRAISDSSREPDWQRLTYLLILVPLVGSGIVHYVRESPSVALRNAAAWIGIATILIVGYSFRTEFGFISDRVKGNLMPAAGIESGGEVTFYASDGGHFFVEAEVDGTPIVFLVDTGASDIVLSPRDARRIGFDPGRLNYSKLYETANGTGRGAPVSLKSIAVGPIYLTDLPASVNQTDLDVSLLGMAFMRRLSSYEARPDRLTLRP